MKKSIVTALFALLFASTGLFAQGVKAEMFATEVAKRLMLSISPNRGNSPSAYVYNWDYSTYESRYTIKFSATWHARKCWMCDGEALFEVIGYLEVGRDGSSPLFTETSRNQAVRDAWSDRGVAAVVAAGAIVAGSANSKN